MSIDSHLSELVRRHQAIEEAILAEINHPASDDIKVHELKRKKLLTQGRNREAQATGRARAFALKPRNSRFTVRAARRARRATPRQSSRHAPFAAVPTRRIGVRRAKSGARAPRPPLRARAPPHRQAVRPRGGRERCRSSFRSRSSHCARSAPGPIRLIGLPGEQRAKRRVVEPAEFAQGAGASRSARPRASPPARGLRTCSTGRRPGSRRSHRRGFRSRPETRAESGLCARW